MNQSGGSVTKVPPRTLIRQHRRTGRANRGLDGPNGHAYLRRVSVNSAVLAKALESVKDAKQHLLALQSAAEETAAHRDAVDAFAETLRDVLGDRELSVDTARRAALAAAAGSVWEDAIGPLLTGAQARELLGVSRQRLSQLVKADQLIVLTEHSGSRLFPAWQFSEAGKPMAELIRAHRTMVQAGALSPWSAASWCSQPHPQLDGRTPHDWALAGDEPQQLHRVAEQDAARAGQ